MPYLRVTKVRGSYFYENLLCLVLLYIYSYLEPTRFLFQFNVASSHVSLTSCNLHFRRFTFCNLINSLFLYFIKF